MNFVLCNLTSLEQADEYTKKQSLTGAAMHCTGRPTAEYGLQYIPHKTLFDKTAKVVKNFSMELPQDLDALLL